MSCPSLFRRVASALKAVIIVTQHFSLDEVSLNKIVKGLYSSIAISGKSI